MFVNGVHAENLDLNQALAKALATDPRVKEKEQTVAVARATLDEALGNKNWIVNLNMFAGLTPAVEGDLFNDGSCQAGACELRSDRYKVDAMSLWTSVNVSLIKPLYTFGKIENYSSAAQGNIEVKEKDVQLQRNATVVDVKRAYYGLLAAEDTSELLNDVSKRLQGSLNLVKRWLEEGEGNAKQSDLYALESGQALVGRYLAQADGLANVARAGLKVLTNTPPEAELTLAEEGLTPIDLPEQGLTELQQQALTQRPEMGQVEAGLRARRSLVEASKADRKPNLYTGLVGTFNRSPNRDRLDNPYLSDPFNDYGFTPIIGIKWDFKPDVSAAKIAQAEAELNALIAKSEFARQGIPFEVSEAYYQMQAAHKAVKELEQASRSARRWMVSAYTDFEAGVESADKVLTAFQAYVLAHTDYIKTVYDYNMQVAKLKNVIGASE